MITARTNDGFEIELDDNLMDDAEMVENLFKAEKEGTAIFFMRDYLMSAEDKKRLYDHLRNEKGVVPLSALKQALNELMSSFAAGKNSASSPN